MNPLILRGFPMPPSVNKAYINRRGPGPGRCKSALYRTFEREVMSWAMLNQRVLGVMRDLVAQPRPGQWLHLESRFYFPRQNLITKDDRPKRLDADNRMKLSTDALAQLLRIDDSIIGGGSYRKLPINGPGTACIDFIVSWMSWGD